MKGRPAKIFFSEEEKMRYADLAIKTSRSNVAVQLSKDKNCSIPYGYSLVRKWIERYFPSEKGGCGQYCPQRLACSGFQR